MPLTETGAREWHAANVVTRRKQSEMRDPSAAPVEGALSPKNTPVDLDGLNWRERKDRAMALSEELKLAERSGELVERTVVLATWSTLVASFRARMLAIPSKVAPQIAAPGKVREIEGMITAAVHEALAEVAGDGLPR